MAIDTTQLDAEEAKSLDVAEDSRETDWKSKSFMASMFMGDLDMSIAFPYPEQDPKDAAIGDEIVARVDAWMQEHVDGDAIDKNEEIPAHVLKGLAELGLFGIKIPKEYGGLGLSQTNYMRLLGVAACHCGSISATLSAHQSIGVPQPLKLFGTPEQKKKYLPRLAKGEISAFGLTEHSVGSDPANMETTAELSEDGSHWVLNGEKLWCTNGVIADIIVVMARTPDKVIKGKPRKQITAFIVETDWKGVDILHRCKFMGIRAIENGIVRFENVKVPLENVVGGEGNGLKLALTTLNDGRLGIPAVAAVTTQKVSEFSASWAKTRYQWGKVIGKHEAGADKLARISAAAYAMDTLAFFGAGLSDRGGSDIRMEAATAKMFNSEVAWQAMDDALQLRAGRGFEQNSSLIARGENPFPMERGLRDSRINRIVEGTTDIMHLFLAREALDKHLSTAGDILDSRTSLGQKFKAFVKCAAFYPFWYAKLWFGGLFRFFPQFDASLRGHLRFVESRTRKLARDLFHKMALSGPKLANKQLVLGRIVDAGAELAVMALVASRVQGELNQGNKANLSRALFWLESRRKVVDDLLRDVWSNNDAQAYALARELMDAAEELPRLETPDLQPRPREWGKDITSGRQGVRLSEMDDRTDERAAK